MTDHEKQIAKITKLLGCSVAEAEDIITADKKIDRGQAVDFGLTKEQEKEALKFANVKEHKKKEPMVLNLTKREKKADTTKEGVIQQIFDFLMEQGYENCEITNKSKLISFCIGEDNYEFNLIRKRKKKE